MKHCFFNALLDYSGKLKKARINWCEQENRALEKLAMFYRNHPDGLKLLKKKQPNVYRTIAVKIKNPELMAASDYHFTDLSSISGKLHIIGMSPNNDTHIFETIMNNNKLSKVVFYYRDPKHQDFIKGKYPLDLFECKNVNKRWNDMRCKNKILNCTYTLPDNVDEFIEWFNVLSGDEISTEQVIMTLQQITNADMKRICRLVKEDIQKRNPKNMPTDKMEFIKQNVSISYIGLQQGIPPTVVYVICVMNYELLI